MPQTVRIQLNKNSNSMNELNKAKNNGKEKLKPTQHEKCNRDSMRAP